jgi:hypothetical protein
MSLAPNMEALPFAAHSWPPSGNALRMNRPGPRFLDVPRTTPRGAKRPSLSSLGHTSVRMGYPASPPGATTIGRKVLPNKRSPTWHVAAPSHRPERLTSDSPPPDGANPTMAIRSAHPKPIGSISCRPQRCNQPMRIDYNSLRFTSQIATRQTSQIHQINGSKLERDACL